MSNHDSQRQQQYLELYDEYRSFADQLYDSMHGLSSLQEFMVSPSERRSIESTKQQLTEAEARSIVVNVISRYIALRLFNKRFFCAIGANQAHRAVKNDDNLDWWAMTMDRGWTDEDYRPMPPDLEEEFKEIQNRFPLLAIKSPQRS